MAPGERVDEVLLCLMRRPRSYTREDVAEISCHGGVMTTQRVLETVLAQGARVAEPGEFTKRAFLNGRLDLTQAEAVIDVINARTLASHRAALQQLEGALSRHLRALREQLVQVSVYLEAGIDFPEEDLELVPIGELYLTVEWPLAHRLRVCWGRSPAVGSSVRAWQRPLSAVRTWANRVVKCSCWVATWRLYCRIQVRRAIR